MDYLLLQLNDSVFPIGAYTHSFGLESYIQMGIVKDRLTSQAYLKANLNSQVLFTDLLSIKLIFLAQRNLDKILEIEEIISVSSSPMELRDGTQKLGNRFIKTILSMGLEVDLFFQEYVKKSQTPVHSTAYGVFAMSHQLDYKMALRHYLYSQSSNMVTNCVKSVPLSQNDGQMILVSLHQEFERILEKLEELEEKHLCGVSIHNDIKAMQHETLYSRLYMS